MQKEISDNINFNIRGKREVKPMLWELLIVSEAIRKLLDKLQNRGKKNKNEKNLPEKA